MAAFKVGETRIQRLVTQAAVTFSHPAINGTGVILNPIDDAGLRFPSTSLVSLAAVRGKEEVIPRFATMADWEVTSGGDAGGFEASRITLFHKRVDAIAGFFADLLFRHDDQPLRYTVLGLYRSREDLDLARGHPAIREWADANPVGPFGARDIYGAAQYAIEEWDDRWFPR